MYARISKIRIREGNYDAALAFRDSILPEMRAIRGLKHWLGFTGDDGEFIVITVYESEADAEAALPKALKVWGRMADMLEGPPEVGSYEVAHFYTF